MGVLKKISTFLCSFSLVLWVSTCIIDPEVIFLALSLQCEKFEIDPNENLIIKTDVTTKSDLAILYSWYVNDKLQVGAISSEFTFNQSPLEDSTYTITCKILQGIYTAEQSCTIRVKAVPPPEVSFNEPPKIFSSQENFDYSILVKNPHNYPLEINWFIDDFTSKTPIPLQPNSLSVSKTTIQNLLPNYFKNSQSIKYNLIVTVKNPYKETTSSIHFVITDSFYFTFEQESYTTIYGHPIVLKVLCNNPDIATFNWYLDGHPISGLASMTQPVTAWNFNGLSEDLTKEKKYKISISADFIDSNGDEKSLTQEVWLIVSAQNRPTLFLQQEHKPINNNENFSYAFFDIQNNKKLNFSFNAFDKDNDELTYLLTCNGNPIEIDSKNKKFSIDLCDFPCQEKSYLYRFSVSDGFTQPVDINFSIYITSGPTSKIINFDGTTSPFTYQFDFKNEPKNVTLIFTNTSGTVIEATPTVLLNGLSLSASKSVSAPANKLSTIDFNSLPIDEKKLTPTKNSLLQTRGPANQKVFYNCQYSTTGATVTPDPSTLEEIPSTLLYTHKVNYTMGGEKLPPPTLEIWVANDCLAPSSKPATVTLEMAKALANAFIAPSQKEATNDIYHLSTPILGKEWSPKVSNPLDLTSAFITHTNKIVFLLYDFEKNRTSLPQPSDTVLAGFYHSKDNFKPQALQYSNGEIMLYLDAVLFASKVENSSWSLKSGWPAVTLATLIHEFQHLINFHQKITHANNNSFREKLWLNEICSLMLEDLLCPKFSLDGPRGVAYNDFTCGQVGNTKGRIPLFNAYHNSCNFFVEESKQFTLQHYSLAYSFGAWLLRNFDGPAILEKLVKSPLNGMENILNAIYQITNTKLTTSQLISYFYTACYLSNTQDVGQFYQFNKSTPFNFQFNGTTFQLGSINFFNYNYFDPMLSQTISGPKTFSLDLLPNKIMPFGAYYVALPAFSQNEVRSYQFDLPKNFNLTILIN